MADDAKEVQQSMAGYSSGTVMGCGLPGTNDGGAFMWLNGSGTAQPD
jgi:hypothetical protein